MYTQTGTPYYASPEVWRDLPYDAKSDIWSLGCVVYEAAALKPPFRANSMEALNQCVQKGIYPRIPGMYSEDLVEMIKMLIQVNPRKRPSCEDILRMPIVIRKIQELGLEDDNPMSSLTGNSLLGTIQIPKNLKILGDKLPKPHYQNNTQEKEEFISQQMKIAKRNRSTKDNQRLIESGNSVIRARYPYNIKNIIRSSQQYNLNLSTADSANKDPAYEAIEEERELKLPDIRRGVAPIRRLPPRINNYPHYQPRQIEMERVKESNRNLRLQKIYEEVDKRRADYYPSAVYEDPAVPNVYINPNRVYHEPIVVQPSWWG